MHISHCGFILTNNLEHLLFIHSLAILVCVCVLCVKYQIFGPFINWILFLLRVLRVQHIFRIRVLRYRHCQYFFPVCDFTIFFMLFSEEETFLILMRDSLSLLSSIVCVFYFLRCVCLHMVALCFPLDVFQYKLIN